MNKYSFNPHSASSIRARLAKQVNDKVELGSLIIAALLIGLGALISLALLPVGLAVGAMSIWPLMVVIWRTVELTKLTPPKTIKDSTELSDIVDQTVVGSLKTADSYLEVLNACAGTWQQGFFSLRYKVSLEYLRSNGDTKLPENFWESAASLADHHGQETISIGVILVTLLRVIPGHQQYLAERNLAIEDLITSVDWIHHTEALIVKKRQVNTGGLARDWTAGFTPTLNRLARNMSASIEHGELARRDVSSHQRTVEEMVQFMGRPGKANVALVGEIGVGKSTTVMAFAQRLLRDPSVPERIKFNQVFSLSASSLNANGKDLNMEKFLIGIFNEATRSKNTILFFDDASLFFNTGLGAVDISNILMPVLDNTGIPVVFAFSVKEWQDMKMNNSAIANALNQINVQPSDEPETLQILEDQTLELEARHGVRFTYQALKEAYRLADRYQHDSAHPGRSIRTLEASINHAENGLVTATSVQASIEATLGVKVQKSDVKESAQLLNLEEKIHTRMINQSHAVSVIADSLRRARSGVANPDKPIGTFLFLGPTGVGKTELAKAIASEYFSGEDQIIRVDMNEFTQSTDADRLLDPTTPSGLFAHIRRQPFAVVLFDEIEKGHPEIINILLQLLDEGTMNDSNNQQASFKDAVVIATSNAGAEDIFRYIGEGKDVPEFEKVFMDNLVHNGLFKPEFLNRFDESVIFRPLTPQELYQVVDLLLAATNKNLELQKLRVELDESAKQWLVENGYDARMGARPLRRVVQRTVENIVAKKVLAGQAAPGSVISLTAQDLSTENVN